MGGQTVEGMRGGETGDVARQGEAVCSLSKSRKKFGPCARSVQVRTFKRFPIWFLKEKEKKLQIQHMYTQSHTVTQMYYIIGSYCLN